MSNKTSSPLAPKADTDTDTDTVPGPDYYFNESGLMVFTEAYHLKRGYCCESGCRHCPYGFRAQSK